MKNIFHQQYALIKSAREVVFDFIETEVGEDIHKSPPAFEHSKPQWLLEHNARCYFHWLGYFALKHPQGTYSTGDFNDIAAIRQQYQKVDDVVAEFIETYGDNMEENISGEHDALGELTSPALKVFTHVTTHEFHHKGQMMMMCRQLGHLPPDTDAMRT